MSGRRVLLLIVAIGASIGMLQLLIYNASHLDYQFSLSGAGSEINDRPTEVASLPRADVVLPCAVAGTSLIAEQMVSYEGDFVEDCSSSKMVIASALLLRNTGNRGILSAVVKLERGEEILTFEVTSLPPGESVLVLEKDCRATLHENFTACSGWEIRDNRDWLYERELSIKPVDMQTVSVTNLTDETIENACLYYKTVYADGLFYIGGITHEVVLEGLKPGETRLVRPEYYADIHSRIVRVSVNMR